MVSIKDVAARAGVAISTVSKVLNGYPNVSEKTRSRVQKAIDELHYVPNAIASALSSKNTARIALIINSLEHSQAIDEIDMHYLSGAIEEAKKRDIELRTYFYSMIEDMSAEDIARDFDAQRIGAFIVYGYNKNDAVLQILHSMHRFKSVLVDTPIYDKDTSSIWIDQAQAQYDVAEAAFSSVKGKRLLYLAGKRNGFVTGERLKGIKKFAKDRKLELTVCYGDFSEAKARAAVLKNGKESDMIACASDLMAVGAVYALADMKIKKPVCGFDGIGLLSYTPQRMMTVIQDFAGISAKAVDAAAALLDGEEGRNIVTGYTIGVREYSDVL